MHHFTRLFPAAAVGFTGQSLVSHAGTKILTELIDALGFRGLCEDRLGQFAPSGARHRPGRLIASLALMLAGGGEHVSDLDMLRSSPGIFGPVPSNATMSRFFERTVANPELFSYGFETLTRELRSRAWDAAGNFEPGGQATAADPLIVDLDATLVTSHSDKELAAGTYKGGYGFSRSSPASITARATAPGKSSPACCGPAARGRTAPMTISVSSRPPRPSCPRASSPMGSWTGRGSWSAPTVPAPRGSSSGTCTPWACSSPSRIRSRQPKPT